MRNEIRIVSKNWLWQRAKALETKLLKKYGKSLSASSIDTRFYKCIRECRVDEGTLEIDYTAYRKICRDIEKIYGIPIQPYDCKEAEYYFAEKGNIRCTLDEVNLIFKEKECEDNAGIHRA